MGYEPARINAAWNQSANKAIDALIDWIDSHPDVGPSQPVSTQPHSAPSQTLYNPS